MNDHTTSAVKSADRVLNLFELLAHRGQAMSHTEISEALHIPKSSLSQLIQNLVARDYLLYLPVTKKYELGGRFKLLARQASRAQDIVSLAEPLLKLVTSACGESSALNILEGDYTKVVATLPSQHRLVTQMRLGDLAPLYATSSGKAILAHLPPSRLEEYLTSVTFEAITPKTIATVPDLRRQLDRIRAGELAESFEEFTVGIAGMAVAIRMGNGEAMASLNVACPAARYSAELRHVAREALDNAATLLEERLATLDP